MGNRKVVYLDEAIDAVCMEWCNVKHQDCKHPFDDEKDDYYWCDGCETVLRTLPDLPPAQPERAVKDCRNCGYGGYNDHYCTYFCYCADECKDWDKWKPSSQPEERLKRISDLVEGSIDHFDRDDAMDLLYQIKAVLK